MSAVGRSRAAGWDPNAKGQGMKLRKGRRVKERAGHRRIGRPLYLAIAFLVIVFVAGGASRPDASGQVLVRVMAWLALLNVASSVPWSRNILKQPVVIVLASSICLVLIQLLPLPPSLWLALPGREVFAPAAEIADIVQPWRPLSITPNATLNSLGSLAIPVAAYSLLRCLGERASALALSGLTALVIAAAGWAALQFAGRPFANPFVNDIPGLVSGPFANRNHLALLLAIGCLLAPVWAVRSGLRRHHLLIALVATIGCVVMVGATGSRMGLLLALSGIAGGAIAIARYAPNGTWNQNRGTLAVQAAVAGVVLTATVVLTISLGRSMGFERAAELSVGEDLRLRALPTVISMTYANLPIGIGFGGFDPAFRMWEPTELLQLPYFNHAHNDLLEVILEGGLPAFLLLAGVLIWVASATWKLLRRQSDGTSLLGWTGGVMVAMIALASLVDYPARTPIVMVCLVVAGYWLERAHPRIDRKTRAVEEEWQ